MTALMARRIYPATRDEPGEEGRWFEIDDEYQAADLRCDRRFEVRPLDETEIEIERT